MSDETESDWTIHAESSQAVGGLPTKNYHDPRIPIRRKLQIKLELLRKETKEIEDALTALDKNPEFEKLHDTLTRVSRFL